MDSLLAEATKRANRILHQLKIRDYLFDTNRLRIDPIRVSGELGVPVVLKEMEKLLGAYVHIDNKAGILLNYDRPFGLVTMTCAHELGHFAMQHNSNLDIDVEYDSDASIQERQADAFAYSLLLPNWLLKRAMEAEGVKREQLNVRSIYQLSLRLGLSYTATIWLLHRKKILSTSIAADWSNVQPKNIKQSIRENLKLSGCDDISDIWVISKNYNNYVVEPKLGDTLIVELESHPASGMKWLHSDSDLAVRPILVQPSDNTFSNETEFSGKHMIPHEVKGIDSCNSIEPHTLTLMEKREFCIEKVTYQEFKLGIESHTLENGLSKYERRRRLSR